MNQEPTRAGPARRWRAAAEVAAAMVLTSVCGALLLALNNGHLG